jgi:hypothetical protein
MIRVSPKEARALQRQALQRQSPIKAAPRLVWEKGAPLAKKSDKAPQAHLLFLVTHRGCEPQKGQP